MNDHSYIKHIDHQNDPESFANAVTDRLLEEAIFDPCGAGAQLHDFEVVAARTEEERARAGRRAE
jgi:hypothetical protein